MSFLVLHKSSISFIIELARSVMVQAERFDKHSVDTVVDEFQKYLKDYCSSTVVFWVGDRQDVFWYNQLAGSKYRLLWKVAKDSPPAVP